LSSKLTTTHYRIDADDLIVSVDAAWLEFAAINDAAHLTRDAVVGRALWDFIAGAETELLYRMIFDRCRDRRDGARIPFRCDSPTRIRRMILAIEPLPGDDLAIDTVLLQSEDRGCPVLVDPHVARSDELVSICSWCKRIQLPNGEWSEIERGVRLLNLFGASHLPQITHGLCGKCESGIDGLNELQSLPDSGSQADHAWRGGGVA